MEPLSRAASAAPAQRRASAAADRRAPRRVVGRLPGFLGRWPDLSATRRLLGALSLALVALVGLGLFATSSVFWVEEIMVLGSTHLSSAEIVQLCGVTAGTNILAVRTREIRARLLENPRIAEATVQRKLPDRLVVRVVEREGVALVPVQGQFAEIDRAGLPIRLHGLIGALGLPVVTGVDLGGLTLGVKIEDSRLDKALCCAAALGTGGRAEVSEIHVDEAGALTLYTRSGVPVFFGSATILDTKVEVFLGILADVERNGLEASYIDLRYPRYPVVGSPSGPAKPEDWVDPDVIATMGGP